MQYMYSAQGKYRIIIDYKVFHYFLVLLIMNTDPVCNIGESGLSLSCLFSRFIHKQRTEMHTYKKKLCNNPRDVHFIEPIVFFSMWTGFETVHSYGVNDRIKINFCSEKDNLGKIHLMGEKKKKKKKK